MFVCMYMCMCVLYTGGCSTGLFWKLNVFLFLFFFKGRGAGKITLRGPNNVTTTVDRNF